MFSIPSCVLGSGPQGSVSPPPPRHVDVFFYAPEDENLFPLCSSIASDVKPREWLTSDEAPVAFTDCRFQKKIKKNAFLPFAT